MFPEPSRAIGDFDVVCVVSGPPFYQNGYAVRHRPTGEHVLIDPGADAGRFIEAIDGAGGRLVEIWLTHAHPDHIAGVHDVQAALGVPCRAHVGEKALVERVSEWSMALTGSALHGPSECAYFDGEPELDLGGAPVRTVFCPGHTPGGTTYVFDGFAFTGDTLFNQGVGRTDFPGGDARTLMASITGLLARVPEETVLYSGHGPEWTAGDARRWWSRMV